MSKVRARKIKLLLFDVDGVMTDGSIWLFPAPAGAEHGTKQLREAVVDSGGYGIAGTSMVEAKGFNAHDGAAFSLARLGGLKTGLITKRISETVALRARDLKIEHVYQGANDKLTAFAEILKKEGMQADEACFVGDDVIDLPVMRVCGLAVAVRNARKEVKEEADIVTEHRGGDGAVRDVVEYVLKAQDKLEDCIDQYIASRTPESAFGKSARRRRKR